MLYLPTHQCQNAQKTSQTDTVRLSVSQENSNFATSRANPHPSSLFLHPSSPHPLTPSPLIFSTHLYSFYFLFSKLKKNKNKKKYC